MGKQQSGHQPLRIKIAAKVSGPGPGVDAHAQHGGCVQWRSMLTDRSSRGHGRARSLWNESPHQFAGGRYSKGMLLQLMGAFADVEGSIIPQPLPDHRAKIACQAKWFVRLAEQAPTGPAESAAQQKSLGARQCERLRGGRLVVRALSGAAPVAGARRF